MKREKNEIFQVRIEDMSDTGEGIGKTDGFTWFVKDAVIGDLVEAKVMKVKKSYGFARLMQVLEPSPHRVTPSCPVARSCGGCQLQAMSYEEQLRFKENKVLNNLKRIGGLDCREIFEPIIGMEDPWHYRNKALFPFGRNKEGKIITGFYAGRTHTIIESEDCLLGAPENAAILSCIRNYMEEYGIAPYQEETHSGLVRHVLIRKGFRTGQILVCLVINGEVKELRAAEVLVERLKGLFGSGAGSRRDAGLDDGGSDGNGGARIVTIACSINREQTNVILGTEIVNLYGSGSIVDFIGDIQYRISPLSFYQVNPVQTERLYGIALEYAGLSGEETVWDLYCGIGTISLFLAQRARKVCGVEIVPQAVEDARMNAALNGITNVEFFVGKAEEVLPEQYERNHICADVIVVDPPRKGCDQVCLDTMIAMAPKRIVYVSCDSATLARDLRYLGERGYEVVRGRMVDMFSQTGHVETVCLLSKLNVKQHIEVELTMDEMDLTAAEKKASYEEIKEYVLEKFGLKVGNLYRLCGEQSREKSGRAKMLLNNDMTKEEVKTLIFKAKSGDNIAWENLYHHFEKYVHSRAWNHLKKLDMTPDRKKDLEEELYQAGWQGFLSAVWSYDPRQGEFLTYATHFIDGEMAKEMKFVINPHGFTEMPDFRERIETPTAKRVFADGKTISVDEAPDRGKYSAERRTLQILEILRLLTDETHSLSKEELSGLLHLYRTVNYKNGTPPEAPNTLTRTLEEMLAEVDPLEYTGDNEGDYRIRYEGYRENRLKEKRNKEKGKKSADITDFSYVHTFSFAELDKLIQMVCFSDLLSNEEKKRLADKLVSTSSIYYRTPFYDGNRLKFRPQAVHGRFSTRTLRDRKLFAKRINLIQQAIKNLCQIRFRFNGYTSEHTMAPKTEYLHVLSPYHLVVYHDNYYCIGMKKEDRRIWHYRVDLMSDVEFVTDEEGKPVPINVCAFEGLPISNACWDPEKYMAEHLYMAYDEPREIQIKLRSDGYTILHDWFGDHYEKTDSSIETDENGCGVQYDIVKVRTSPSMIVHWAMQYAGAVEIMDEEIRDEIKIMQKKYE